VAVYPASLWAETASKLADLTKPFDLALAPWALALAADTRLIQQVWGDGGKSHPFDKPGDLEATVDPRAVIYHRDKAGRIIDLMRQKVAIGPTGQMGHISSPSGQMVIAK
jgi:hypothetical protein